MTDESPDDDWRQTLARLRKKRGPYKKKNRKPDAAFVTALQSDHGRDAIMTLVSIMKDDSDPRLQITAAKALLDRNADMAASLEETAVSPDDIDAAIAVAKAVLDELAARKAGGVAGAGELAATGTPAADNA
jgi:hypothetical protein